MNPFDFIAIRKQIGDDAVSESENFTTMSVAIADEPFWSGGYSAGVRFAMAMEFVDGSRRDSCGVLFELQSSDFANCIPELKEFIRGAREYLDK